MVTLHTTIAGSTPSVPSRVGGTVLEYRRCSHHGDILVAVIPSRFRTNNQTTTVRVCHRKECIADAMAWLKRATGNKPVWFSENGRAHRRMPSRDLTATPYSTRKALTR